MIIYFLLTSSDWNWHPNDNPSGFSIFLFVNFNVWNFRNKKETNELPFGLTPHKDQKLTHMGDPCPRNVKFSTLLCLCMLCMLHEFQFVQLSFLLEGNYFENNLPGLDPS